jgi:hypothetical protein
MSNSRDDNSALIPSEVRDLIEESRTVQDWLDRLASHESDASPEVFDRVREDYNGRLEKATERLAQHRSELAGSLDTRRSELESLQADRDSQAADLEEARLRHMVGEFTDDRWNELSQSIEGSLSELSELLEMEDGAVAELAAIVTSIDEGRLPTVKTEPATAFPDVPEEPAVEATDEGDDDILGEGVSAMMEPAIVDEDVSAEPEPAIVDEVETVEEETSEEDSPEDETSVVEASAESEESTDEAPEEITVEATDDGPDGAPSAEAVAAADAEEGGDYLDELEFLESLSLDESDRFDAVSAMLDEDDPEKKK